LTWNGCYDGCGYENCGGFLNGSAIDDAIEIEIGNAIWS
jgi:hypothetical protein